jgi:exodeoxyribonuclease VIII
MRYEDIDAVNASTLKVLWRQSPKHYQEVLRTPRKETPALALGIAAHMAILEPMRYARHYAIRPEGLDGRTAAGKAWLAQYGHLPTLTHEQHGLCLAMQTAVEAHPVAAGLLGPGQVERILQWTDEETGVACKGRLDLVLKDGTLVDLKTARDVSPRVFGAQAAKLGYHFSLAFYRDGLATLGCAPRRVFIVAVESVPPHDVVAYRVPEEVLDRGRDEYRNTLVRLVECRNTGRWPGQGEDECTLEFPRWAIGDDDLLEGASWEAVP